MRREETVLTVIVLIGLFIFMSIISISVSQWNSIGKTAAQHEKNILDICQAVPLSDYTNCLRREWDSVNDVPDWVKEK